MNELVKIKLIKFWVFYTAIPLARRLNLLMTNESHSKKKRRCTDQRVPYCISVQSKNLFCLFIFVINAQRYLKNEKKKFEGNKFSNMPESRFCLILKKNKHTFFTRGEVQIYSFKDRIISLQDSLVESKGL